MVRDDIQKLELNKILLNCAEHASLAGARKLLIETAPSADVDEARHRLDFTAECHRLLFEYGSGRVEEFGDVEPLVDRAAKGSTLTCAELRDVNALLRSARLACEHVGGQKKGDTPLCEALVRRLVFDGRLEKDISSKVISDDALADDASDALYGIRSGIRSLNEKIRERLNEYVSGKDAEFLQESIVTTRGGRYVVPVKAEHKSHVKGFVHDRSASGATFFIEPEYVLELNNELVALQMDEKEEEERILHHLSSRVGVMRGALTEDVRLLNILESGFAKADYSYAMKAVCPEICGDGKIEITCGRHPLIDAKKVVPVSLSLGGGYNFLILSGANTGGKTVTLKMCGLFCLMAACGIFIPASEGSRVSVFENIFCDVGDAQSIEESLSTFSSHITNICDICDKATGRSLVLLDELGGGTNPDEGQAIAKAVLEYLTNLGCEGIITTHFTPLKEYAYIAEGVENASMEFDIDTLRPLYRIKVGLPGASNAFAICKRLGMNPRILKSAEGFLSDGARSYENIMRRAEESRVEADKALEDAKRGKSELDALIKENKDEAEKLRKQQKKISDGAKSEARRIIEELTSEAESMVKEIEDVRKKQDVSDAELVRVRTLKNKLQKNEFDETERENEPEFESVEKYVTATAGTIAMGQNVYIPSMRCEAVVNAVNAQKDEAEVLIGSLKYRCKISDLSILTQERREKTKSTTKTKSVGDITPSRPVTEINVIGMGVEDALEEVDAFIDKALLDNLEEIKVIHGVGKGILRSAIAQHLKKHKSVKSFRLGQYGEGESGVTVIKLR